MKLETIKNAILDLSPRKIGQFFKEIYTSSRDSERTNWSLGINVALTVGVCVLSLLLPATVVMNITNTAPLAKFVGVICALIVPISTPLYLGRVVGRAKLVKEQLKERVQSESQKPAQGLAPLDKLYNKLCKKLANTFNAEAKQNADNKMEAAKTTTPDNISQKNGLQSN